jgi:hypothetical protein
MLSRPDQALFQENTTSRHCGSATQVAGSTDKGNSMLPSIISTENHATTDTMDMNDELLLGDVGMIDEGLETLPDYGSSDVDSDLDDEELESDSCEEVHPESQDGTAAEEYLWEVLDELVEEFEREAIAGGALIVIPIPSYL